MTGKRNTLQKEIIQHTLRHLHCHPTAGQVYEAVHRNHPTVSRSTVYRVLGQLAEEGEALRLHLAGDDDRFDGNIGPHCHVRCIRCGAVADIPWSEVTPPAQTAGYVLTEWVVEYAGICPACQEKGQEEIALPERHL